MIRFYLDIVTGKDLRFSLILLILAFASGYFTFRGLAIDASGFFEYAACSVFAIASGVMIFLFWTYALILVPRYKQVRKIVVAWIVVVFGVFNILGTSSFLNGVGIVGDDALEDHTRAYVVSVEDALDRSYQRSLLVAGASLDLKAHHSRYDGFATSEFARGAFSQSSGGTGAVHRSLVSTAGRLGGLSEIADAYLEEAEAQHALATAQLVEMRRIELLELPLEERMRMIGPHSDIVQQALAKMDTSMFAALLTRAATILPTELEVPQRLSRNTQVAQKQAEAIARLKSDLARTSQSLASLADTLVTGSDDIGLKRFKAISAAKALLHHWDQYIPNIIAAVAIDLAALPVLLFFSLALSGKSEADIRIEKFKNTRLEDLEDAKLAAEYLRSRKLSSRETEDLTHSRFDSSNDGEPT